MPVAVRVREALALARRAEHTIAIAADHEATVLNAAAGRPLAEARASTDPRTGIVRHSKAMQTLVHPLPRADFLRHGEAMMSPVLANGAKRFLTKSLLHTGSDVDAAIIGVTTDSQARRQQAEASTPPARAVPLMGPATSSLTGASGGAGDSASGATTARSRGAGAGAAGAVGASLSASVPSAAGGPSAGAASPRAPRTPPPPGAPTPAVAPPTHAHAPRRQGLRRTYVPALHDTPPQAAGSAAAAAAARTRSPARKGRPPSASAGGAGMLPLPSTAPAIGLSPTLVPADLLDRRSAALLASHRVLFMPPGQQVDPLALRAASTGPACSPVAERRVAWMMHQVAASRPVAEALQARVAQYARDATEAAATAAMSAGNFIARNASPGILAAAAPAVRDQRLRSAAASTAERVATALAAHERIVAASKAAAEAQLNRGAVLAAAREVLERRMTWATVVVLANAAARMQRVLEVQIAVRTHAPAAMAAATRLQSWWRSLAGLRFYRRLQRALPGLRKALWRWRIFIATQRKARAAAMLRRFAQDYVLHDDPRLASTALCRYMRTWRRSVVRCQRTAKAWLACRAARMELLRLLWSKLAGAQAVAAASSSAAAAVSSAAGRRGSLTGGRRPSTAAEAEGAAARLGAGGMRRASRVDIRGLPLGEHVSSSGVMQDAPSSAAGTVRRSSTANAAPAPPPSAAGMVRRSSTAGAGSGLGGSNAGTAGRLNSARRGSVAGSGGVAAAPGGAAAPSASRRRGSVEASGGTAIDTGGTAGANAAAAAAASGAAAGGSSTAGPTLRLLPRTAANAAVIDDVLRNYLRYRRVQHVQEKARWLQKVTAALLGRKPAGAAGAGSASARAGGPFVTAADSAGVGAASGPAAAATSVAEPASGLTVAAPAVTTIAGDFAAAPTGPVTTLSPSHPRLPPLFLQPSDTELHSGDAFGGAAGGAAGGVPGAAAAKASRAEAGKVRRAGGFAAVVAMAMADAALRNQRSARRRFASDGDGHALALGQHPTKGAPADGAAGGAGVAAAGTAAAGSGIAAGAAKRTGSMAAVAKAALNAVRTSRVSAHAAAAAAADASAGAGDAGAGGRSSAREGGAAVTAADTAAERAVSARTALLLDAHTVAAVAGIVIVEPYDPAALLGHACVRAAIDRLRRFAVMRASEERDRSSLSRRRVVFGSHVSSTGEAPASGTSSVANLLAGQGLTGAGAAGGHSGPAGASTSSCRSRGSSKPSGLKAAALRRMRGRGGAGAGASPSDAAEAMLSAALDPCCPLPMRLLCAPFERLESASARDVASGRASLSYRPRGPGAADAELDDALAVLSRLQGMAIEWRRSPASRAGSSAAVSGTAPAAAAGSALAGLRLRRVILEYKPTFESAAAPESSDRDGGGSGSLAKNASLLTWAAGSSSNAFSSHAAAHGGDRHGAGGARGASRR